MGSTSFPSRPLVIRRWTKNASLPVGFSTVTWVTVSAPLFSLVLDPCSRTCGKVASPVRSANDLVGVSHQVVFSPSGTSCLVESQYQFVLTTLPPESSRVSRMK